MNEHPILMTPDNARLILDGRKTQTRRVMNPQPGKACLGFVASASPLHWIEQLPLDLTALYPNSKPTTMNGKSLKCPYGKVGDKLWVRETHAFGSSSHDYPGRLEVLYKTTHDDNNDRQWVKTDLDTWAKYSHKNKWRSSMFMPRFASRIDLTITNIRVQKLQEISLEDVDAEGVNVYDSTGEYGDVLDCRALWNSTSALWNSINGKKHPWESNPWVWCLTFSLMKKPGR